MSPPVAKLRLPSPSRSKGSTSSATVQPEQSRLSSLQGVYESKRGARVGEEAEGVAVLWRRRLLGGRRRRGQASRHARRLHTVEMRGSSSGSASDSSRQEQHEKGRHEGARWRRGPRISVGGAFPARAQQVAPSLEAYRSSTRRSGGRPVPPDAPPPHLGGRPASPAAGRRPAVC